MPNASAIDYSDVMITGTGSLARSIIMAFSTTATRTLRIGIGARNRKKAEWLALAANTRATAFGLSHFFHPVEIDWSSQDQMATALATYQPKVIIHTATLQSSWKLNEPSAWASLIAEGGFVLTAPMHAVLPGRIATAARAAGLDTIVVNGCHPDFVNGLLKAAGCPVTVGFGNISILSTAIAAFLSLREPGAVRMLAQWEPHVADFREPWQKRRDSDTMVWIKGERVQQFHRQFQNLCFPPPTDDELNLVTGSLAVPMTLAFLNVQSYVGHAPGPGGYPGGYPVAIRDGKLSLDLPEGVSESEAIAFNTRFEEAEHVHFDRDRKIVELRGRARDALIKHLPQSGGRYAVSSLSQLEAAAADLLDLRDKLGGA